MATAKKPSIVVLGSKGFIGSTIVANLSHRFGKDVRGISSATLDMTRAASVVKLARLCSGQTVLVATAGIRAERDASLDAFASNISILVHLAQALERQPVARCIYLSTVSVYAPPLQRKKITEKNPIGPTSLYALAKYAGERILETVCTDQRIPLLILRLPRVYGAHDAYATYGPSAFIASIQKRGALTLYGQGNEAREFLSVEDLADIVNLSIARKPEGIVNVVSGASHTFEEAAAILSHIAKKPFTVRHVPSAAPGHDEHYDNTAFRKLFPSYSFTPFPKGLAAALTLAQRSRSVYN